MKRTTPAQRRKRLVALITFGTVISVMAVLVVLDLPDISSEGASGTMMESEASAFAWRSGAAASSLDDALTISFDRLPSTFASATASWRLVASRSEEYDASAACTLRAWKQGDEMPGVDFLMTPRSAECLDAGPWHVFAVGEDGTSHKLAGTLMIQNGRSSVELTDLNQATGHKGNVEFELAVHRPASAYGFDGVFERPLDVWITNGDDVCVAAAEAISVPRGTVSTGKNWDDTRLRSAVSINAFRRVREYNPFASEGNVSVSTEVELRGDCDVEEGVYNVLIGPTERGYAQAGQFRVHARPAQIDTNPIVVSIPTGESGEARFSLRNYSDEATRWSAEAEDSAGQKWLAGSRNQTLKGRDKDRGLLSFSAHDLAPGLYTTDVVVRVDDFYGTEVRIPVEMKVLPARSRTAGAFDAEDELPGEFTIGNYPNPFSAYTTVRIEIKQAGNVSLMVYDMTGRQVDSLVDEYLSEGVHEFRFEADNLASGSYIYRVVTPTGQKSETMTLVR